MMTQLRFTESYQYPDDLDGITIPVMLTYFAKYPGLLYNILGREGWLRKIKLAVIDYDNMLYMSPYDS